MGRRSFRALAGGTCAVLAIAGGGGPGSGSAGTCASGRGESSCGAEGGAAGRSGGAAEEPLGWPSLEALGGHPAEVLKCQPSSRPRDVGAYCAATQASGGGCSFGEAAAAAATDDATLACLYRCLFGGPDLNLFQLQRPGSPDAMALLSPMAATGYHAAPFLDRRSLPHGYRDCQYLLPYATLAEVARWGRRRNLPVGCCGAGDRVHFIFHISHTASTLLSRALGEIEGVLALREPVLLKALALAHGESGSRKDLLRTWRVPILPWISRRHSNASTVVVKASSQALAFAPAALRAAPAARAVFLFSGLRTHLTVCLARQGDLFPDGLYNGLDAKIPAFEQYKAGGAAWLRLSVVQRMALAWMKRLAFAQLLPKARTLHLRMDEFLSAPADHLVRIAVLFGLSLTDTQAASIAAGPVFAQYAKDSTVPWNASTQATMLKVRYSAYRTSVEEGVGFASELVDKHSQLKTLQVLLDK